jgi:hypothetical protein
LVELIFFFDQSGHLLDCVGKITGDGSERHCVGLGLTLMYEMACRSFAGRSERPAEILQFPKGSDAQEYAQDQNDDRHL